MIKVILTSFVSAFKKCARWDGSGRADETFSNRESFQHYGFGSTPIPGKCVGVAIQQGDHIILIAESDHQYRIALDDGEVALYDFKGSKVHLKKDGSMDITAIKDITVNAGGTVQVNATTSATITAPEIKLGNAATVAAAAGIITAMCPCMITGAPHVALQTQIVKA